MLTGQLYITTNIDAVYREQYRNTKILFLCDEKQDVPGVEIIPASILLPPYESVMAELDDQKDVAAQIYIEYLCQKEPDMFIAAIMAALLRGVNILVYLGPDEANMSFIGTLTQFLWNMYGIGAGTDYNKFTINIALEPAIYCKLYFYDLINYEEFFILYPAGIKIEEYVIPKLVYEINPYVEFPSKQAYEDYFNGYKERVKQNNNKILINPITRG